MPSTKNKIVLTGGHGATTALALIEDLNSHPEKWEIVWIGSKQAVEGKKSLTIEFKAFPDLGVRCYNLIVGRVQRRFTRYTITSLLKIPAGFVHAFYLLIKIKPKIVVSFGGFAAFPVVVAAFLMGIPVIVHEQTAAIGLANKYSIPFASKIAISREISKKFYPLKKTVLTGNPVRKEFFQIPHKTKLSKPPLIYATGGSRGSQNFNLKLMTILPDVLKDTIVIHQCGDLDLQKFERFRESLPKALQKNYSVCATIAPKEVSNTLSKADIVIGRAGANTVSEVIAARRPAIFVPIPWSQHDEQTKNANLAQKEGLAIVLNQDDLTPEIFKQAINGVFRNYGKMTKERDSALRELDQQAAHKLSKLAESLI